MAVDCQIVFSVFDIAEIGPSPENMFGGRCEIC